jgi:hypothetical protein
MIWLDGKEGGIVDDEFICCDLVDCGIGVLNYSLRSILSDAT